MKTYVTHYFNFEYIGIYLLVSLIGLAVVIGIVLGVAKLKTRQRLQDDSLSHKAILRINRHHQERKRSGSGRRIFGKQKIQRFRVCTLFKW